jgi:hypothetical protein
VVQKGLNEGRLKFGYKPKPKMQVDYDPLKDESMMYTDIAGCNTIEAIVVVIENSFVDAEVKAKTNSAECQIVGIVRNLEDNKEPVIEHQSDEQLVTAITPE